MKTSQPNLLLAEVLLICSVKLINAWVIKWLFLKPSWNLKSFLFFLERELTCGVWGVGLFHPTKSQSHRTFKDMTIFYNMSLHRENIILTE